MIIDVRLSELCTTWLVQWITEFIILCILQYWNDTMMQIGYLTWMSCMPRVDMFSLLAVLLFHGGHANRQF
jgi:hypothetical protein